MTRYFTSTGERNQSSHRILESSSRLTDEYKGKVEALFSYYYPIEISMEKSKDEKISDMIEWWEKSHKLLIEQNLSKQDIEEMVTESTVEMRPGVDQFIEKCKNYDIPFLIFSAGIANVIEQVLTMKGLLHARNMHIVSNQMGFNEKTGRCDHFKEPLIHTFNKNEIIIRDSPYHTTIEDRGNVILLGDSLSDVQMADGIRHHTCLYIGFLNYGAEKLLDKYMETYDIVIVGDGTMNIVNFIIDACSVDDGLHFL
ncbi:6080_t:CDS:2 [Acaulospora colombiana]|uniref:6080_t:CDS:1 n=1 Tax=Acaulospora colombiana TaxID=27376 RepID=A0ACA9K0Y2_9GLOM|nr:6080_t:CDS:2 [Acaulospora colombiana]